MLTFGISQSEFLHIVSEINTNYAVYKNQKVITQYTTTYIYKIENHGFNNYKFFDKILSETVIMED